MSKNLLIVESPAKVKTISKFLGKDFDILASYGHVIDLPKSTLGIDVDNDFQVRYITIRGKGDILSKLKSKAKASDNIYLATDPDREGETISWHIKNAIESKISKSAVIRRVTFNEITKTAVTNAIKNPRDIDMNLVNSQQARRVIDRIVGYKISPILWEKIKRGLSAGRVQSVALRLICEREKEISEFLPMEYWTLDVELKYKGNEFTANFYGNSDRKIPLGKEDDVNKIIDEIGNSEFLVKDIKKSKREKKAPLPFTTSTLQQEAGKSLNFAVSKTMRIAQRLYEGLDIKGRGTTSLITYLRTDSTRVSNEAIIAAKDFISEKYGNSYVSEVIINKETDNKVQDAHEAIRPTYIEILPDDIKDSVSRDEYRLYNLIWKRFIASRMTNAIYDTGKVSIEANGYIFNMNASKLSFNGFMSVYVSEDEKNEKQNKLPEFNVGDKVDFRNFLKNQHFTQPPAHFTESSLVKMLEEDGIGRPSTYAPTINTLLNRRYITKEKKNLFVTELGNAVNDMVKKSFSDIVDEKFTANMEKDLDEVEKGAISWKEILYKFYPNFEKEVEKAYNELEKVQIAEEVSEEKCDNCGANLIVKYGPYGKFLACPNFPDCRFTKPYIERTGFLCPQCKKHEIIKLRTKKGRIFFGCEDRDCDFKAWQIPKDAEKLNVDNEKTM